MSSIPFLLFLILCAHAVAQMTGNTTCKSSDLDWYQVGTGETPCRTYERLRQQCNSNYRVSNFVSTFPGDTCDDSNSPCCCNSIAFYLSMLCYNCQYDVHSEFGADAPDAGTYRKYLQGCPNPTNQSLPIAIQAESCNNGIKIYDTLYNVFWVDGKFFYAYTKQQIVDYYTQHGVQASFTHCNNLSTIQAGITGGVSTASESAEPTSPPSPSASAPRYASVIWTMTFATLCVFIMRSGLN